MTTILYSNNFNTLTDQRAAPAPRYRKDLDIAKDLIAKGLIWNSESTPVDNLWKTCSRKVEKSASTAIPFKISEIDSALTAGGLLCGAVHEFYYQDSLLNQALSISLPTILARNAFDAYYTSSACAWHRAPSKRTRLAPFFIAWIGRRAWPTPFALPNQALPTCLFIDPPNTKLTLWAIETALRSPLIKLIIADCPTISMMITRRLSLRAQTNQTTAILLRSYKDLKLPSSSHTRWALSPIPSSDLYPKWSLSLERNKGGIAPHTSWIISLESDYEDRETLSLRTLSRVGETERLSRAL